MVSQYQAIRNYDAKRLEPGWSFCNFFSMKEELACFYETFDMHTEALLQYDELEALFSALKGFSIF